MRWASSSSPSPAFAAMAGLLLVSMASVAPVAAQVVPPPPPGQDSATVVPDAAYRRGALYRALGGSGYRDLWTTPVRVPVADLDTLGGGGLTPVELGGGMTTQTLHLRGADGHRYVFRSVDKTPVELVEDLVGTPAESIVRDQMSSFHPSAALIVARLLDAVGVLHADPRLMVVPDDPRLGAFRDQFRGMLVLFEERPDDLPDGAAGFAGSTRVVQTDDLFDELEEDQANRVELVELLRARLVDLLVGDRDRSVNNHLWARFEEPGGFVWRPVPRDRDQSFVRFDGALKSVARLYDYRLVAFDETYSSTEAVTRNAWDIDRNFLVGLDRETWVATVDEVVRALSDEVLREAVARMPAEHRALIGEKLENALRRRRDELPRVAEEFYRVVFRFADVHATDLDELARVDVAGDGTVRIALRRRGMGTEPGGEPYFDRAFSPRETREVRLYLHGGDDRIAVDAQVPTPITIRVLGGGGADTLTSSGGASVRFYDAGGATSSEGSGVRWIRSSPSRPFSWFEDSYDIDFGSRTAPRGGLAFDSDRGFVPTIGLSHTGYGFDRRPFAYAVEARGGWAVTHRKPLVDVSASIPRALAGADVRLEARYTGIEIVRFFGFGNAADAPGPDDYYKVEQGQLQLAAELRLARGRWRAAVGPILNHVASDQVDPTYLTATRPFGISPTLHVGARLRGMWDGRDDPGAPTAGFRLEGGGEYDPALFGLDRDFGSAFGEASMYMTPSWGNPTLAIRVGAKRIWGRFPYYEAAFLGGTNHLRGLPDQRFAGDAAIYGGAELRAALFRATLILPLEVGVLALTDVGRTYLDDASPGGWHRGHGGGIWLAPLSRTNTFHVAVVWSEGGHAIYAGSGFAY